MFSKKLLTVAVLLLLSSCNHHKKKYKGPIDQIGPLTITYVGKTLTPASRTKLKFAVRSRLLMFEFYYGKWRTGWVHVEIHVDKDTVPWGNRAGVYFPDDRKIVIGGGSVLHGTKDKAPYLIHELFHAYIHQRSIFTVNGITLQRADPRHLHPDWPFIDFLDKVIDRVL